jgi:VRR-NUC domain
VSGELVVKIPTNERELQAALIQVGKHHGWLCSHTFNTPMTKGGWRAPASTGFPDLIFVHPDGGLIVMELKSRNGHVRPEQERWINAFRASGIDALIVYPEQFRDAARLLRRTAVRSRPAP